MLTKHGWEYIKKFHLNPPRQREELPRHPEIDRMYDEHRESLQRIGVTIDQYIFQTIFDTPERITQGWQITINNFPCYVTDDIDQLVLWIYPGRSINVDEVIWKTLYLRYRE